MVQFLVINLCVALNKMRSECFQFFGIYLPPLPETVKYRLLKFQIKCINDIYKDEFGYRCWSIYLTPKEKVVEVGGFVEEQLTNYHIVPILGFYLIFPRGGELPLKK